MTGPQAIRLGPFIRTCGICSGTLSEEVRIKASDLFVQALEAEGVEYIFGIPGEENLDLLHS